MLDDASLPEFDFCKKENVSVNSSFMPTSNPGPTLQVPPGDGKAIDYFQLFYDDTFLQSIVDMTNSHAVHVQVNLYKYVKYFIICISIIFLCFVRALCHGYYFLLCIYVIIVYNCKLLYGSHTARVSAWCQPSIYDIYIYSLFIN